MSFPGLACREALRNSVRGGRILAHLFEQVERGIETGRIVLDGLEKNDKGELTGKLDPRMLTSLTRSVQSMSAAVEKALIATRLRTGPTEDATGTRVAMLLEGLSPEELAQVEVTGIVPGRVMRIGSPPPEDLEFVDPMKPKGFDEDEGERAEDPAAGAGFSNS